MSICSRSPAEVYTVRILLSYRADVVAQVGDTLFVHGGLTAGHLRSEGQVDEEGTPEETVASAEAVMEAINSKVSSWMLHGGYLPRIVWGEDSPVWIRMFSSPDTHDVREDVRAKLEEVSRWGACIPCVPLWWTWS